MTTQEQVEHIRDVVEKHFHIHIDEQTRRHDVARPRQLFWMLAKMYLPKITLKQLGEMLDRHYSTVIHGVQAAARDTSYSNPFRVEMLKVIVAIQLDRPKQIQEMLDTGLPSIVRVTEQRLNKNQRLELEQKRQYREMCERIGVTSGL